MRKIVYFFILCLFFSCRPVKTVIQTEYRDSVMYKTRYDSIYFSVKDSVFIKEKNDTVLIEKWKTVFKDKVVLKTDTVMLTNTLTNVQYVEKEKKGIHVFLTYSGVIFWLALLVFIIVRMRM